MSKYPPHRPILLDFGLTKSVSSSMKQALAKMFLACAEVCMISLIFDNSDVKKKVLPLQMNCPCLHDPS